MQVIRHLPSLPPASFLNFTARSRDTRQGTDALNGRGVRRKSTGARRPALYYSGCPLLPQSLSLLVPRRFRPLAGSQVTPCGYLNQTAGGGRNLKKKEKKHGKPNREIQTNKKVLTSSRRNSRRTTNFENLHRKTFKIHPQNLQILSRLAIPKTPRTLGLLPARLLRNGSIHLPQRNRSPTRPRLDHRRPRTFKPLAMGQLPLQEKSKFTEIKGDIQ